jgi:hypothetical protein
MPARFANLVRTGAVMAVLLGSGAAVAAPDWDRVANIKGAAAQIGDIQAREGADRAFKFIAACYRTHGLASKYSKAFEGCIAQDYMQSRALALVYERVEPEQLRRIGAPSAADVMSTLKNRLGAAFGKYAIPSAEGQDFLRLVETHGMPVFVKAVFKKANAPLP